MLDRYGRQVFTECYFPWSEEIMEVEDSPSQCDDASSDLSKVLAFRHESPEAQAKAPDPAPLESGSGGRA